MNLSLHLTFKKYNEIDCLQFEIYLYGFFGFKSMIKCFVYISKVWWNSLFIFPNTFQDINDEIHEMSSSGNETYS